jgi:hypothetical protein
VMRACASATRRGGSRAAEPTSPSPTGLSRRLLIEIVPHEHRQGSVCVLMLRLPEGAHVGPVEVRRAGEELPVVRAAGLRHSPLAVLLGADAGAERLIISIGFIEASDLVQEGLMRSLGVGAQVISTI